LFGEEKEEIKIKDGNIHQKYKAKENTSRHKPKKKQGIITNMQALPIDDIL
jgi:hypothetical protein